MVTILSDFGAQENKVCQIWFSWWYQKQPLNINSNLHFPSIYYLSHTFLCFWNTWTQHRIFTIPLSWCSNTPHSVGETTLPLRSKLLVLGYRATEWDNWGLGPSPYGSGVCALIHCAMLSKWWFSAPLLGRSLNKCCGFPGGSDSKESTCHEGDLGSIPGLGRSPGGEHGNPLQYSCLENPHRQRTLVGYSPRVCKESDMAERLSTAQTCVYWVPIHCVCMLSPVRLFANPWTVACQALLSIEFSRQEYQSGLPFPIPGDLLNQESSPGLLHLLHWQADSLPAGNPHLFSMSALHWILKWQL